MQSVRALSLPPLLRIENLTKRFSGIVATNDVSLAFADRELHAVIGPNGAGKSTLVAQIMGEQKPDAGRIIFADRDIGRLSASARARLGIARSYQVARVFPEITVLENVLIAVQGRIGRRCAIWRSITSRSELLAPAREALATCGLSDRADAAAGALSHGERRALELATVLAVPPRLLLLDEPMAGLGAQESAHMTRVLSAIKGHFAIILIEHDMEAVFALADRITVLVYGRVLITDTPERVRTDPSVREAYLGEDEIDEDGDAPASNGTFPLLPTQQDATQESVVVDPAAT